MAIKKWSTKEELENIFHETISEVLVDVDQNPVHSMNREFGLYEDTGYVKNNNPQGITLDHSQIISPYRTGFYGTIAMNKMIQSNWRNPNPVFWPDSTFVNGDKIIRINNWYRGRQLTLSNGSIGLVTFHKRGWQKRFFFKELERPLNWIDDEENFELAYTITVHKSIPNFYVI